MVDEQGHGLRRGTFLGAPWGAFADVKKVWSEFFETKPYKAQAFGIAGNLLAPIPATLKAPSVVLQLMKSAAAYQLSQCGPRGSTEFQGC